MGNLISHMFRHIANWWRQPIELTNVTGTQFMDLNDDSLQMILRMVSVMDLCSLMKMSKIDNNIRLMTITCETFRRKYKFFNRNKDAGTCDETQLLTNFGPLISHVGFTQSCNSTRSEASWIIESRTKNCNGTLKPVVTSSYKFDMSNAKVLFSNLKKLHLFASYLADNANGSPLVELSARYKLYQRDSFYRKFCHLEHFGGGSYSSNFRNIINNSQKLKSIELQWDCDPVLILPVIADLCSDLRKLTVRFDGDNNPVEYEVVFKSISGLIHLEDLTITGNENDQLRVAKLIRQLSKLTSLKKLCLEGATICPTAITSLSQLKMLEELGIQVYNGYVNFNALAELGRLRKLSIAAGDCDIDLVHLLERLPYLEKLRYIPIGPANFTIDKQTIEKIADVRSRCARPKLDIDSYKVHLRFTLTNSGVVVQNYIF